MEIGPTVLSWTGNKVGVRVLQWRHILHFLGQVSHPVLKLCSPAKVLRWGTRRWRHRRRNRARISRGWNCSSLRDVSDDPGTSSLPFHGGFPAASSWAMVPLHSGGCVDVGWRVARVTPSVARPRSFPEHLLYVSPTPFCDKSPAKTDVGQPGDR